MTLINLFSYLANLFASWLAFTFYGAIEAMVSSISTAINELQSTHKKKVVAMVKSKRTVRDDPSPADDSTVSAIGAIIYIMGIVLSVALCYDAVWRYFTDPFGMEFYYKKPNTLPLPLMTFCIDPQIRPDKLKAQF